MTRDDIRRMAQEASSESDYDFPNIFALERFAALVAAAERERMKAEGWRQCAEGQRTTQYCGLLDAAVKAEREACAKTCESQRSIEWITASTARVIYEPTNIMADSCAAAIRARGVV